MLFRGRKTKRKFRKFLVQTLNSFFSYFLYLALNWKRKKRKERVPQFRPMSYPEYKHFGDIIHTIVSQVGLGTGR